MDSWKDLDWQERRKKRREYAKELVSLLDSCKSEHDCMCIALKLAMMAIEYPRDCPSSKSILERLGTQLSTSTDERDLVFILTLFPDLVAARAAERQLAVIQCPG